MKKLRTVLKYQSCLLNSNIFIFKGCLGVDKINKISIINGWLNI